MTAIPLGEEAFFKVACKIASPQDRADYLNQVCGDDAALRDRVALLLKLHEGNPSYLESPAFEFSPAFVKTIDMPAAPVAMIAPGTIVGPFKLLQQIGEGGMGTVFMAEQTQPVRRKVALKIVKPGMNTREVIARFEAERQALALMDHPNIARVFDGGSTDAGHPYFAMELVNGIPITDYCDLNNLPVRERLELFITVCHAVQHAHQKGIIHRDMKPSNVMVTLHDGQPVPKVIDFGVAKAIGQQLTDKTLFTQFAQLLGTPLYMSPEQAELTGLDIDTRSDIYSLGVLLYELLTGTTPLERARINHAAMDEVRRMIREDDPPSPSMRLSSTAGQVQTAVATHRRLDPKGLSRLVRGDLDWIVMKALEKDRTRRYETANGFAADVGRYLRDELVEARPPSAVYRFHKFARRNRVVFSTGALVLAALMVGTFVSTWQAFRATRAERLSDQRLETANSNFRIAEAHRLRAVASEHDAKTKEGLAQEARKEAVESLQDALAAVDQMLTQVGDEKLVFVPQMESVRRELLLDAVKFYQRFLQKYKDNATIRLETARAYLRLARIQRSLGQIAEAEIGYIKAFAMFDEIDARFPLEADIRHDLSMAHIEISTCCEDLGKHQDNEIHIQRAITIAEELTIEFPQDVFHRDQLAYAKLYRAALISPTRPEEAEKILRRNLTLTKNSAHLVDYCRTLGELLKGQGRISEAELTVRQALAICETCLVEQPTSIWIKNKLGNTLRDLGGLAAAQGRWTEAEAIGGEAIKVLDKLATDYPTGPDYRICQAGAHQDRARVLTALNRTADAATAYRRALDLFRKLASDFPHSQKFSEFAIHQRLDLAKFLLASGQTEGAFDVYRQGVKDSGNAAAEISTKLVQWQGLVPTHIELGRLLATSGKAEEAETAYRWAMEAQQQLEDDLTGNPKERNELAQRHFQAGKLFVDAGRPREAEKLYGLAVSHFVELVNEYPKLPEYQVSLAHSHNSLGWLMRRDGSGRLLKAEEEHRLSLALFEELASSFSTVTRYQSERADLLWTIGYLLQERSDLAGAKPLLEQATVLAQSVVRSEPKNQFYRESLHRNRRHLAYVLSCLGEPAETEQNLREILADCEKQVAESLATPFSTRALAQTRIDLATHLKNAGRFQDAELLYRLACESYDKLVADAPTDAAYRRELAWAHQDLAGMLLYQLRQPDESAKSRQQQVALFAKLVEDYPNDPVYREHLGHGCRWWAFDWIHRNRPDEGVKYLREAIKVFEKSIADFPNAVPNHHALLIDTYDRLLRQLATAGNSLESEPGIREIINVLEKHATEDPSEQTTERVLAMAHSALGSWFKTQGRSAEAKQARDRARELLEKLTADFPTVTLYRLALGDLYRELGELDKAFAEYSYSIEQNPAAWEGWSGRAFVRFRRQEWDNAIADFSSAIGVAPNVHTNWWHRGHAYCQLREWDKAAADFGMAIELAPAGADGWNLRGVANAELGRWVQATSDFEKAAERYPDNPLLQYRLALTNIQLADVAGYRKICAKMLEKFAPVANGDSAQWTVWTCVLGADALADWTVPLQLAEKAVADNPKNYRALYYRGAVLYRASQYQEALLRLTEAEAAFLPGDQKDNVLAYDWLFLAMTHHRLGHVDDAKTWCDKAVQWIDQENQKAPDEPVATNRLLWNRRLTLQLLRREVEELLSTKLGIDPSCK